uniref:Uncharacterized protein n=1 Tax=Caenorhabditis japonica TaxID=281687 RepID=A0A8R1IC52_CAEJA
MVLCEDTVLSIHPIAQDGNFDLEENSKSGRPCLEVEEEIEEELEKEPKSSLSDVASILGLCKGTVYRRLRQSGRCTRYHDHF